jgi:hypothetical protein
MRSVVTAVLLSLAAVSGAAAQVVRLSVSTGGTEANGPSGPPSIAGPWGRFVVFSSLASNLVAGDTNGLADVFLRDRDTNDDWDLDEAGAVRTTRVSVGPGGRQLDGASTAPVISADGRYVVFVSTATNLVPGGPAGLPQVFRVDRTTGAVVRISESAAGAAADAGADSPAINANGNVIAFRSTALNLIDDGASRPQSHIYVRNVAADTTVRVTVPSTETDPILVPDATAPSISASGARVVWLVRSVLTTSGAAGHDLATGQPFVIPFSQVQGVGITADGLQVGVRLPTEVFRYVIDSGATTSRLRAPGASTRVPPAFSPTGRLTLIDGTLVGDFHFATTTPLPVVTGAGVFDSDSALFHSRWLVFVSGASLLPGGADTNGVDDVHGINLERIFDADSNFLDDRWEALFGLTDVRGDPDGDRENNAQEETFGTHPNGRIRRFLAEGATGSFFHTTIALANPSPTLAATAVLRFDNGTGPRIPLPIAIPAGRSVVVDVGAERGLEASDVSTTVESDRLIGIQRSMTWGRAPAVYGSHAETATASAASTWFLAEGTTAGGFDLFYLLQNPQPNTQQTMTVVSARFLLPSGATITRTYGLPPESRTTIYVNQIAGLEDTDVSADLSADGPFIVERAMYRNSATEVFALGTGSLGITAPATSWFFAEGATGSFFDLYILIANPGLTDAIVRADYARSDGAVITRTYTVRAHSRFSVYVDDVPGLEHTSVATTLTSTNGVPVVAERAMYWPGRFSDYYEGHTSAGSTSTAIEWVVAGGEHGGPSAAQTFVLIANTASTAGEATLTVLPDIGFTGPAPAPIVVPLPPHSRTTVPIAAVTGPFGVRVLSTGGSPVPLVVESAVYRSADGVLWSAGSNALATPVP